MKHFRDLVLSTKEPVLHNVLWIQPDKTDISVYHLYMYEDGWKELFDSSSVSSGIQYRVIEYLADSSDGTKNAVVQFYDPTKNPNVDTNLYPKTIAALVSLNNGLTVQQAIENINNQLATLNSRVKKAIFINAYDVDYTINKANKTYWVHQSGSDGRIIGEPYFRDYVSETSYVKKTFISVGDVLINTFNDLQTEHRMHQVITVEDNEIVVQTLANLEDIIDRISDLHSLYLRDVNVDGSSVVESVTPGSIVQRQAFLGKDIREVYMVDSFSQIDEYYPSNKKNKIFFYIDEDNQNGHLIKCTVDTTRDTRYSAIKPNLGELFYNINQNSSKYKYRKLYVLTQGDYSEDAILNATVSLLPDEDYVSSMINTYQGFAPADRYAHLDYASEASLHVYKALKQGEEQMVVLKWMGNDYAGVPGYPQYDYDDDGFFGKKEIDILYGIILQGYYIDSNTGKKYTVTTMSGSDQNPPILQVAEPDGQGGWNTPTPLTEKVIDVNGDHNITATEATKLYDILLSVDPYESEFSGSSIFAIYDPDIKKIVIGYNYKIFMEERKAGAHTTTDPEDEDRNPYILLIMDPSPNVIYCDICTDILYRWRNAVSQTSEGDTITFKEMVPLTRNSKYITNLNNQITSLNQHLAVVEEYIESQGGVIYVDEPGEQTNH